MLRARIFTADLVGVWNMKPLIDGNTVLQITELPQGPIITKITQEIIEWQLDNPGGTPEQCAEFLQANKARYKQEATAMRSSTKKK